jgi:hypothetical protein
MKTGEVEFVKLSSNNFHDFNKEEIVDAVTGPYSTIHMIVPAAMALINFSKVHNFFNMICKIL